MAIVKEIRLKGKPNLSRIFIAWSIFTLPNEYDNTVITPTTAKYFAIDKSKKGNPFPLYGSGIIIEEKI